MEDGKPGIRQPHTPRATSKTTEYAKLLQSRGIETPC